MSGLEFKSPAELQIELGKRLRRLRLQRNIDQRTLAEKAGVALTALQKLEAGRGSTVQTLVRTLKALNYLEGIEMLAHGESARFVAKHETAAAGVAFAAAQ